MAEIEAVAVATPADVEPLLRVEAAAAERLAATVRFVAIAALAAIQLALLLSGLEEASIVVVSWALCAVGMVYGVAIWLRLRGGYRPLISYLSVAFDAIAVTAIALASAAVIGGGAHYAQATKSPFTFLYFLVVALAGQRQAPRLANFAGAVCAAGYLSLLLPVWLATPGLLTAVNSADFSGPEVSVPRIVTVAILIALSSVIAGVTASRTRQLVRSAVTERIDALQQQQRRELLVSSLERYFPQREALLLMSEGRDLPRDGESRDVTLLTADIRGFTTISEKATPEVVVGLLNSYFEAMVDVIFDHQGTLISFVGDALWAVFGLPAERPDDADRAVAAALVMRSRLAEMNAAGRFSSVGGLQIGIAVHSGRVVAGSVGSSRRLEYTVIGDTVNSAARLEEGNKHFGTDLLITEATASRLTDRSSLVDLGTLELRGRSGQLRVYSIPAPVRIGR